MWFKCGRLVAFAMVLLLIAAPHAVVAQKEGDRVRVVMFGDSTWTGDVTETSETGFTITLVSGLLSGYVAERDVEYQQVETLEVRTCCVDFAWLAPTLGGLVAGGVVGNQLNERSCTEVLFARTCSSVGHNDLVGALIGGAVGLAVGRLAFRERWEAIGIPEPGGPSPTLSAGFRPYHGGTAMILGSRIRFRR